MRKDGSSEQTPVTRSVQPAAPPSRRSFFGVLLALGSFSVGALLSVPLLRFSLFPLIRRTTELKASPVGAVSDLVSSSEPLMRTIQIEQLDGWRKTITKKAVYVTKDPQGNLHVLTSICPHLGCTIPWNKETLQFICPCHGATFKADGTRVSGPSLRGMDPLDTEVQDGQLLVKFQYFRQLIAEREVVG